MTVYKPEGKLIYTRENQNALKSPAALAKACRERKILEARAVVCDSEHNLHVDLGCMEGFLPREEGALGIREGNVRDIAVISRVNKPVCFYIDSFITDSNGRQTAILSRRAVQADCCENYLSKLLIGDIIDCRITHLEQFGAFADIACGLPALLPIDMISVSRISHPRDRFSIGMDIKAIVKTTDHDHRISLTHKELLGTWSENAALFSVGETVAGIIRSVEDYGIFVELTPNLAGLAESHPGVHPGTQASVYIKNILDEKMKIKLALVETFDGDYIPAPPRYFYEGTHIERFDYSPPLADKQISVIF